MARSLRFGRRVSPSSLQRRSGTAGIDRADHVGRQHVPGGWSRPAGAPASARQQARAAALTGHLKASNRPRRTGRNGARPARPLLAWAGAVAPSPGGCRCAAGGTARPVSPGPSGPTWVKLKPEGRRAPSGHPSWPAGTVLAGGVLWSGDQDELSADVAALADVVGPGGAVEREGLDLEHQLVLGQ